jgi:outer membrane protein OmpA-like peptidoglycan-associated protein
MRTNRIFARTADSWSDIFATAVFHRPVLKRLMLPGLVSTLALGGCAASQESSTAAAPPAASSSVAQTAAPAVAIPAPVAIVEPVPFDEAVAKAAAAVFSARTLPPPSDPSGRYQVVIDPLVDGMTGSQSAATRLIQTKITQLVDQRYPQFEIKPFSTATVASSPLVLVGTFTPVNREGKTAGMREAYRFCLVLADLKSGKTVAKGVARARMEGVDTTPTTFFQDSPVWTGDKAAEGYISTCQGTKVGDPINPAYLDGILTAALISDAIEAYDGSRYQDALDLYRAAAQSPAGDQLRAYNGIYLANLKLGRRNDATMAFGDIVDYGLRNNRLAVKFLFRPGSTAFVADSQVSGDYDRWLQQIADRAARSPACLEVAGHTSPTGPAPLNDRLSLLRAEYVKTRLGEEEPMLATRTIANGMGSRDNLIGTGRDDNTDALDRRVEFKVIDGC